VSERAKRSERALKKTRIQVTTKLTHSILLTRLTRFALASLKMRLASLGAAATTSASEPAPQSRKNVSTKSNKALKKEALKAKQINKEKKKINKEKTSPDTTNSSSSTSTSPQQEPEQQSKLQRFKEFLGQEVIDNYELSKWAGTGVKGGYNVLFWHYKLHEFALVELWRNFSVFVCFCFPYMFGTVVSIMVEFLGSPHWAPVCLWYAFLVHTFCVGGGGYERRETEKGSKKLQEQKETDLESSQDLNVSSNIQSCSSTATITTILRILLPLFFVLEGFTSNCFALNLNGNEILIVSGILSSIKNGVSFHPLFMLVLSIQILLVGSSVLSTTGSVLLQYCQVLTLLNTFFYLDNLAIPSEN